LRRGSMEGIRSFNTARPRVLASLSRSRLAPTAAAIGSISTRGAKPWTQMVSAAQTANPGLRILISGQDQPRLEFWRTVPAPAAYEKASRMRMRQSSDPGVVARSRDSKPVEGPSEIDVVISTNRHLVFIEAKLGSDISMCTTYDPCRNQLIRNIDCLLECAAGREPMFWMLVRDSGPRRAYCQLVDAYRTNLETLVAELPHCDPRDLRKIAQNISVIRWQDLAGSLFEVANTDSAEVSNVKQELKRRVWA